jgi:hypothetical protein
MRLTCLLILGEKGITITTEKWPVYSTQTKYVKLKSIHVEHASTGTCRICTLPPHLTVSLGRDRRLFFLASPVASLWSLKALVNVAPTFPWNQYSNSVIVHVTRHNLYVRDILNRSSFQKYANHNPNWYSKSSVHGFCQLMQRKVEIAISFTLCLHQKLFTGLNVIILLLFIKE